MKTRAFLEELSRFGWELQRTGKHILLTNRFFSADRPVALRYQDAKDIDPIVVSIQAKHAGLIWDQNRQQLKLNPNHPYYNRYRSTLGQVAA